ncbi:MAG: hypothetical protein DBY36_05790, partial [Clostridiales bacterium]
GTDEADASAATARAPCGGTFSGREKETRNSRRGGANFYTRPPRAAANGFFRKNDEFVRYGHGNNTVD